MLNGIILPQPTSLKALIYLVSLLFLSVGRRSTPYSIGHGTLQKPWSIAKMRDYFMTIKSAKPQMTPEAETIIKTYVQKIHSFDCILLLLSRYYAMSRRITESSGRHITVRQLESTVRLAQGRKTT